MIHISKKISTIISLILTIILVFALCYLIYWLPEVVTSMINATDNLGDRANITDSGRLFVLIDAYTMVAVAFLAVILLFFLLRTVLREMVFSSSTTRILSALSYCCFTEGILFLILIIYFQLAFGLAIAAFFLGLCLRVVKNVIEEATRIKAENDFTV